jgi:hypothetical protein
MSDIFIQVYPVSMPDTCLYDVIVDTINAVISPQTADRHAATATLLPTYAALQLLKRSSKRETESARAFLGSPVLQRNCLHLKDNCQGCHRRSLD